MARAHNRGMKCWTAASRRWVIRLLSLLATCALGATAAEGSRPSNAKALLITHANVVDVRDGHLAVDRAILIEGDRITAIDGDGPALMRQAEGQVEEVDVHG